MENAKTNSITIDLEIDGKIQKFVTPQRITGKLYKPAILISRELEPQSTGEFDEHGNELFSEVDIISNLDSYMQFVCDVFGNQFTLSEFEEGVDSRDLIKIIYATTFFVVGQVGISAELLASSADLIENAEDSKKN